MQAQILEGYWENDRFYPYAQPVRKTGRRKAQVLVFDEPAERPIYNESAVKIIPDDELPEGFDRLVEKAGLEEAHRRVAWLKELDRVRELAKDEPPFELPPRAPMRPPILFED